MANKTLARLPLADQIAALEQITVAEPRGLHPLWGKHQNAFAVEGEEVRALPHIAHGAFRFIQHPASCHWRRSAERYSRTAGIAFARADDHVPAVSLTPDLRVTEVVHTRRVSTTILALKVDPVAAGGQTLHLIQIGFVAGSPWNLCPV